MKKIWITWENQRRNRELSAAVGAAFFELVEIDQIKNKLKKYSAGLSRTLQILWKEKPDVIFCQNPSLVLSLFLVLIKRLWHTKVCVDAHNAGLFPAEGRSFLLLMLARVVQRLADLTIVTNENLKMEVERNGGKAFVLPDRIPHIQKVERRNLKGRSNILFICSYGADEPYREVFKAASLLPPDICIYVTGNYHKKGIDPISLPSNLILTGFVEEKEYLALLNSVEATIDLTTREDCLVCGAYETVAVEKPMILSDTQALREYFCLGTVYVSNTAEGIRKAIEKVLSERESLEKEIKVLKELLSREWEARKENLEQSLFRLVSGRVEGK